MLHLFFVYFWHQNRVNFVLNCFSLFLLPRFRTRSSCRLVSLTFVNKQLLFFSSLICYICEGYKVNFLPKNTYSCFNHMNASVEYNLIMDLYLKHIEWPYVKKNAQIYFLQLYRMYLLMSSTLRSHICLIVVIDR